MFNKITENVEIHQTLPDVPNMTTQELKKEWDKGSKIIKEAFNALIEELNKTSISSTVVYENEQGQSTDFTIDSSFNMNNYKRADFVVGRSQGGVGGVIISVDLTIYHKLSDPAIPLAFIDTDSPTASLIYNTRIKIKNNDIEFANNGRHEVGGGRSDFYKLAIYKIIAYEN